MYVSELLRARNTQFLIGLYVLEFSEKCPGMSWNFFAEKPREPCLYLVVNLAKRSAVTVLVTAEFYLQLDSFFCYLETDKLLSSVHNSFFYF